MIDRKQLGKEIACVQRQGVDRPKQISRV